jgi:hypothetical protein
LKEGVFFHHQEEIYDWNGKPINSEIRDAIAVNNIVRVVVKHDSGYAEAIYVKITTVEGSDLVGIVLDTYRQFFEAETIYVENGESIRFPRVAITEIPLSWNENLA